jgi:hypothetical protein
MLVWLLLSLLLLLLHGLRRNLVTTADSVGLFASGKQKLHGYILKLSWILG